ncbi:NEDD8-conjugating enzyme Ubc12 [Tritrichomonas foetus]|uniref:E2 NEDD8-conjugating enzyme n=1 Tax=Tritrichomonas foetus TaxID=1144522 RepID=A0A1J4KCW2_9EUKA|nr:NEDD8-conjugating enzyme Ubc12 [Tritrichomonas foetus]|eukprot:OHT07486.1 NEDD8-conjugating enzyme Ubc12 [Tritrichomonas foetus]
MSRTHRNKKVGSTVTQQISGCEVRLQKDIEDLDKTAKVVFPNPNDIKFFHVTISPDSGTWAGGTFVFSVKVGDDWPISPPSVIAITKIWHPNIAENGEVCLSMLKENYSPTISISHIIAGLQFLFCEPNPQSPLNKDAAIQMFQDKETFAMKAKEYIKKYCKKGET